jgi:hypothetical protein
MLSYFAASVRNPLTVPPFTVWRTLFGQRLSALEPLYHSPAVAIDPGGERSRHPCPQVPSSAILLYGRSQVPERAQALQQARRRRTRPCSFGHHKANAILPNSLKTLDRHGAVAKTGISDINPA